MSKLLIVGAGGFARELLEAVVQGDRESEIVFFDDVSVDSPSAFFGRYPKIGSEQAAADYFKTTDRGFALGIGNPDLRLKLFHEFIALGGEPRTIISPFAKVGMFENHIGEGSCVLSGATVESNNQIGRGSIIHVDALVSHDVKVGQFCEISPKACLLGNVEIGDLCSIGTGAILLPGTQLGKRVVVGAGAVVTKEVEEGVTVVGVPARPIRR